MSMRGWRTRERESAGCKERGTREERGKGRR